MKKLYTFNEFLDISNRIDEETLQTVKVLSEAHPKIRNDATIQRILNDKNARVSVSELGTVLRAILQTSVYLAKSAPSASDSQKLLIIAEQNVLTVSASTISAAVAARLQNAIDKLSRLAQATSFKR